MINLLPLGEKKKIQQLYRTRLSIVALELLLFTLILGTLLILPSFFLVDFREGQAKSRLDTIQEVVALEEDTQVEALVHLTSRKFGVLAQEEDTVMSISEIFDVIMNRRLPGVQLTGFFYESGKDENKVVVNGRASDRDGLIAFTDDLRKETIFFDVILPVSYLLKSEDIPFSFSTFLSEEYSR